ncbi:hypothetical protein DFH06DRAFT_1487431 [Mycena polygramma]|nr:hypothetical protein DFH06DRAFT_1487431 [Mycena polygramma]
MFNKLGSRLKATFSRLRSVLVSRKWKLCQEPSQIAHLGSPLPTAECHSGIPRLPPELIEIIICQNATDRPTLRSCALVCRAFLPSSQAYIFCDVRLSSQGRADQLHDLLVDSPHLRTYIRSLGIFESSTDRSVPYREVTGFWLAGCPSVAASLGLLNAVTDFTLMFQHRDFNSNWDGLPEELRKPICALCQRSPLTCLRLCSLGTITDPAEFSQLVSSAVLTDLSLSFLALPSLTENKLAPFNRPLPLTRLTLWLNRSTFDGITRRLLETDSLRDLQILDIAWNLRTSCPLSEIISVATSIRELFLIVSSDVPGDHSIHSLSRLEYLRLLDISFRIGAHSAEPACNLLAGLLTGGPKSLTALKIVICMTGPVVPTMDWSPVRSVLSATAFPSLTNIAISVVFARGVDPEQRIRSIKDIHLGFALFSEQRNLNCVLVLPQQQFPTDAETTL